MSPPAEVSDVSNSATILTETTETKGYSNIHPLEQISSEEVSTPTGSVLEKPTGLTESTELAETARVDSSFSKNKISESLSSSLKSIPSLSETESIENTLSSPIVTTSQYYSPSDSSSLPMSSRETSEEYDTSRNQVSHFVHHHHYTTSSNMSLSASETLTFEVSPSSSSSSSSSSLPTSISSVVGLSDTEKTPSGSVSSIGTTTLSSIHSFQNSSPHLRMNDESTVTTSPSSEFSSSSSAVTSESESFSLSESVTSSQYSSTVSSIGEDSSTSSPVESITAATVSTTGADTSSSISSSTDEIVDRSVSDSVMESNTRIETTFTGEVTQKRGTEPGSNDSTTFGGSYHQAEITPTDTGEISASSLVSSSESATTLSSQPQTSSFDDTELSTYSTINSYTAPSDFSSTSSYSELETSSGTSSTAVSPSEDYSSPSEISNTDSQWTSSVSSDPFTTSDNSKDDTLYGHTAAATSQSWGYYSSIGTTAPSYVTQPSTGVSDITDATSYDQSLFYSSSYPTSEILYKAISGESSQEEKDHSPVPDLWVVSTDIGAPYSSSIWDSSPYYYEPSSFSSSSSSSSSSLESYGPFETLSVSTSVETQKAFGVNPVYHETISSESSSYYDSYTPSSESSTSYPPPHLSATAYQVFSAAYSQDTSHATTSIMETLYDSDNFKTSSTPTYEVFGPTPVTSSETTVRTSGAQHTDTEVSSARASPEPSPSPLSRTSVHTAEHTISTSVVLTNSKLDTTLSTSTKKSHISSDTSSTSKEEEQEDKPDFTTSEEDVLIIYTQNYDFTGPSTSFVTGIPSTIKIPKKEFSTLPSETFSVLRSTVTADVSLYEKWLDGGKLGNDVTGLAGSGSTDKGTIIGSVVGSVCGVIVCGLIIWGLVCRQHKRRGIFDEDDDEDANNFKTDERHFLSKNISRDFSSRPGYHSMFTKKQTINAGDENRNPFNNEFDFNNRTNPPPIPAPRKARNSTLQSGAAATAIPAVYDSSSSSSSSGLDPNSRSQNVVNRDSYFSSVTGSYDSSSFGSSITDGYSLLSTTPAPAPEMYPNAMRNASSNSQGFLRELI